jgi:uncharacterized protein
MSRKLLALCMFASLLPFSACSKSGTENSLSPSPIPPSRPDSFRAFATVVRSDLETYWRDRFQAMSKLYRPITQMRYYSRSGPGPCGRLVERNAEYCPRDRSVSLHEPYLNELMAEMGDFAAAVLIAHEMGHHVQDELDLFDEFSDSFSIKTELQADCLAGAWIASEGARGLLATNDLQEAAKWVYSAGDRAGSQWYDQGAHGTATLRIRAFTTGVQQPTACFQE